MIIVLRETGFNHIISIDEIIYLFLFNSLGSSFSTL